VQVACRLKPYRIEIQITDEGSGFDPELVPDPTDDENLEIPSGRGMMLMRCFMTDLRYNQKGNSVTMEKVRGAETKTAAGENNGH
ncbi:MAG: ATP-binding protein, partial [bacterium]